MFIGLLHSSLKNQKCFRDSSADVDISRNSEFISQYIYKMPLSTICLHSSEGGNCRQIKNSIISDDGKFYEKNEAKWWDRNYSCRQREEDMKIQVQWPENQENWLCSTNPKVGRLENEEKMMFKFEYKDRRKDYWAGRILPFRVDISLLVLFKPSTDGVRPIL